MGFLRRIRRHLLTLLTFGAIISLNINWHSSSVSLPRPIRAKECGTLSSAHLQGMSTFHNERPSLSSLHPMRLRVAAAESSISVPSIMQRLHLKSFTPKFPYSLRTAAVSSTPLDARPKPPEMLVDLGGASFTVHFFEDGNQKAVVKSKTMLTNNSCEECIELRKEGLEQGWIKERTPPDYAELSYTFADYSNPSKNSWEEVSSYLSRNIRAACHQISEIYPSATAARVVVLQTGKIREIAGSDWEQLMRKQLQKAFGSATSVDFPQPPHHALLSNSDEAYFEGLMMFKYHNLSAIDIKIPSNGPVLKQDNTLALSIGSSSTQMYTLDNKDGSLIAKTDPRLGVYPPEFSLNSLNLKTGVEMARKFKKLFSEIPEGKKFLLLVNAIGYVMKEIPGLAGSINRQEPIPVDIFCRESRKWLQSMRSYKHRRRDLDFELYHQLQLLSGLVEALERDSKHVEYIIVEKKGHLKPNGLYMTDERKLDYHWVTAVHKYGVNAAFLERSTPSPAYLVLAQFLEQLWSGLNRVVNSLGNNANVNNLYRR